MRISMQPNFVTRITNCGALFWKGLQRVSWNEPSGFDFVFVEKLQYTCCSVRASKKTFVQSASELNIWKFD